MVRALLIGLLLCSCQSNTPIGYAVEGFPLDETRIMALKEEVPIPPKFVAFYLQWPHEKGLLSTLEAIEAQGCLPILTWEPFKLAGNDILAGKYDAYLQAVAEAAKRFNKPFIIRLMHEMNLQEYHWGTVATFDANSPKIYIELFRYVVTFFRKSGAGNVLWALCPNADSVPNTPWNQPAAFYPGDDYVDLLGMDGYNWDKKTSFRQIFTRLYQQLQKISSNKPLYVFETAADENKLLWLKEAESVAQEWGLKGIIWFQVDKERAWKL